MSILIGVGAIALNNARDKGGDSKRKQDLSAIKGALVLYFQDNRYYPCDTVPPINCGVNSYNSSAAQPWIPGLSPAYIQTLPKDPLQVPSGTNNPYQYAVISDHSSYTLWAQLKNLSDPQIYNKPSAACNVSPPSGSSYNYCLRPEQ